MIKADSIKLFHGTSRSRAEEILIDGFRVLDFEQEISSCSSKYSISSEVLSKKLYELGRIAASRRDDKATCFSTNFEHASSYASRAPEIQWDCLWAIFSLHHPEIEIDELNQSDAGHFWILTQMEHDPPVVLTIEATRDLVGLEFQNLIDSQEELHKIDPTAGAEVRIEFDSFPKILTVSSVDFRIDGSLLRFITGLSPTELAEQVIDGLWGQPIGGQWAQYWPWSEIKQRLNSQRIEHLYSAIDLGGLP